MFETITEALDRVFKKLRSRGILTEDNIKEGLREVRTALLEADVNYKVVKEFINRVTERAVGQEVIKSVTPGQQIVKIVHDELVNLMGPVDHTIPYNPHRPTVIMMVGLQGGGKTTTCGKLARYLTKKGRRPLLVAADLQRPAAVEQLKILGNELNIPTYSEDRGRPPLVCQNAIAFAEKNARDVVILDTAGRLHINEELMAELKEISARVKPDQTFLVCDAMTGQDAVNSAKRFNEDLGLDGVILTKLDGDARGGAALSIKAVTGKPIKFIGVGEKLDALEEFHPRRMADRILGMGDVITLVEKAKEAIDKEQAVKLEKKLRKGEFDLEDMLHQLQQIKRMGSFKELLSMIPGVGKLLGNVELEGDELKYIEAMILSMTPEERRHPEIIDGRRRLRIARGSGTSVQDVNALLKQFKQMRKMMKEFGKKGKFPKMPFMPRL